MTPLLVLGLLRRLPEGSHYGAAVAANAPEADSDTPSNAPVEPDPAQELRTWTHDRMLMAQLINSVNMLIRYSINWEQGKAPTLPIVGPASWRGEGKAAKPKPISVRDAFKRLTGK